MAQQASSSPVWSIVLAAGEGSRLGSITVDAAGRHVPKQFCSLLGGDTLLQDAIARASCVSAPDRLCAVVAADHREWWQHMDLGIPEANLLCQPCNRGTANGLLFALSAILRRDPEARVVVLPSDHHIHKEAVFRQALRSAAEAACQPGAPVVMLGIEPEFADPELGYILPTTTAGGNDEAAPVSGFFEKPSRPRAQELIAHGALWNAFVLAAPAASLLRLFLRRMSGHVRGFATLGEWLTDPAALASYYATLDTRDFSRDVVPGNEAMLRVRRVPSCGWSDLGTPGRLVRVLRRRPRSTGGGRPVFVDLSSRVASAHRGWFPLSRDAGSPSAANAAGALRAM